MSELTFLLLLLVLVVLATLGLCAWMWAVDRGLDDWGDGC